MGKKKIKFYLQSLAEIFLVFLFIAITVKLIKSPNPRDILYFYIFCEILGFYFFSIYTAFVIAFSFSIIALLTLIIKPDGWIVFEILAAWGIFYFLNVYLKITGKEYGNQKLDLEKIEQQITTIEAQIQKFKEERPILEERLEKYKKLANFSFELGTTLDFEKISKTIITFAKQVFRNSDVMLVAGVTDIYDRWIYEEQKPLLVEEAGKDYRFPKIYPEIASLIAYPIFSEGKIYSIIKVLSRQNSFQAEDLRFLSTIASLSSIAFMNANLFEKTQELAITDSLTGLFNHTYFLERVREEVTRAKRFGEKLCFMMLDIDHFKKFNDTYGHQTGDEVLARVADRIKRKIRATDLIGRYGGEEFAILLPKTDKKNAIKIAEGLRKAIQSEKFNFSGEKINVTVTVGVSFFPECDTMSELVASADEALYKGKKLGRNRVALWAKG